MLGSTDSDPDRERELMSLLAGLDVRGVIVTPSDSTLDNLAVLAGRGIRVVLMDHPPLTGGCHRPAPGGPVDIHNTSASTCC